MAVQLEQKLDKEQILEYYLNTINLGQNAIGVQNASMRYFNKDISQLSISEAAVLQEHSRIQQMIIRSPIRKIIANSAKKC